MESKKDIYNLWIQYTTKNEEIYFRYFISGFVQIWEEQLKIDFDNPPQWQSIKNDLGPHLSRLPEELLPAIGKFLIIAKDTNQRQEQLSSKELNETTLLIKCLTVMSRHFDNITTISNYEYISSIVAIAINIIQTSFKGNQKPSTDEINYIKSFCQLIEVIYDPYLTWRNFLVGNLADYKRTSYSTVQLHVELVPFIYDCFQSDNILYMPDIGTNLIHMLGSFISGSQNSLTSNLSPNVVSQSNDSNGCGGGGRRSNNFQNGMRAICPATVSVVVNLLSTWNCNAELRTAALKCYAIMAIVLQRSNPEERQIDLVTICQFYLDAIQNLLKTEHFLPKAIEEKFDLSGDEDVDLDKNVVDINALVAVIDNIEMFLSEKQSKIQLCDYFIEANYFVTLSAILGKVKGWQIDTQSLATSIVRSIYLLSRTSEDIVVNLKSSNNVANLFVGLKSIGKPTSKLLKMCVDLAYDDGKCEIVVADVIVKLVEWLKHMNDDEQIYLSELLYNICTKNINCKSLVLEEQIIKTICKTLEHFSSLNVKCIGDLIRLVEELGKYSISPAELKSLIWLLREEENFDYRKELLQALASISLNTDISMCSSVFNTFLDIQHKSDGISVPDIRKWTTSGSYGFIFHGWLKLDESTAAATNNSNLNDNTHFRRIILSLVTNQGTGYEIFIDNNGKLVVCVLTKKEFLATTVSSPSLTDKEWHLITVGVIPPKRPFSYTQINVFVDGNQRLGATVKFGAFTEPFSYCTIGCMYERIASKSNQLKRYEGEMVSSQQSSDTSTTQSKGMFPSLMEKTFFPQIVSQVPSYFTLPSRNTQSNDPNVKCYPMGMQDSVFGLPTCMRGQLGSVVLAEPMTNIKTLLEAGGNFASLISQDVEQYDLTSKFVFCYSPTSCYDNLCIDLVPGNKYSGYVAGKLCTTMKIQESINSIGGINTLLPILEIIIKSKENTQIFFGNSSPIPNETLPSPNSEGFSDWEVLSSTTYSEWKMIQNPIACFLCLIRYFTRNHQELNQEQLLKCDGIPILCSMLTKCSANLIDVNVLMSVHVLLESAQNQLPAQNTELIETLLTNLIFNFKIWSRSHYQITIGHIQYISIMIKDDRKYYRKKYGIQFCLDTIRQYYATPENLSEKDVKSVRLSLLEMTKYYIQKDINVKEVSAIISYIASVKHEHLIIEILEMLVNNMSNRYCNDQIFLLMHEPQSAELLYSLLADKTYGTDLYESVLKFINCLLHTNRVSKKHKFILRLNDASVSCQSLYPGLISHMMPLELEQELIINLLEQSLLDESEYGYCGALHLIHNLSSSNIGLKLDVAQKLLSRTFNHTNSAYLIAKQIGWQESIARLLIRRQITNSSSGNNNILGKDIHNVPFEENSEFLNQIDLMSFDEKTMELHPHDGNREHNLILNEIQASVTEAANVIEHEIKEMAETVTEKVSGNFSSVYSMIRQTTSDIQDTFESLAMGGGSGNNSTTGSAELKLKSFTSISTQSSNSTSEENLSIKSNPAFSKNVNLNDESMANIDQEEQLVYLVTNVLFTVLWRGVDNNGGDSWKERGQVIACINLLGLNNELFCSHLTLRLRILEMGIQACLIDLAEAGTHDLQHQQNAAQLLRMVYDLVVLDPNEDDVKKCSTKLLDGVLALLDALMVFQQTVNDDWPEMTRLCLGLLLKCSHHPNSDIVAMATAKLHALLQTRTAQDPHELSYLIFSINKALNTAIDIGYPEQYSFLMPVMKALLEKSRTIFSLTTNVPDLPPTSSGPVFFHDFQMYSGSKQWTTFIEKKIKPLHDIYQSEISSTLWEPLNIFWAECYEACKMSSQKRAKQLLESRRKFQQKILIPWRMRQSEEVTRLNSSASLAKTKDSQIERRWKSVKRFLYGPRGAWSYDSTKMEFWRVSHHENTSRMRLKLEPSLYYDQHTSAANLRDNTSNIDDTNRRLSTDLSSSIIPAAIRDILTEDEVILFEEEMQKVAEPQQQEIPIEKVVISQECDLVTLMTKVKGRLEVTSRMFSFIDLSPARDDGEKHDFRFPMTQIKEVHLRKYNLRRSALEVFLVDQTNYFLNFTTKTRNKIFTKILSLQPPNILYGSGRSPSELLKASGLMQKWINREISNFEYLMHLNTIAGRSYNDLSQYPVFPWILADYTSEILDLTNPKSFRDLSKPIGVVNPKNEIEVRTKYDGFEDTVGGIPKFHYGTHYSNSAGVLHFLLRVEPFTSLHIDLQSGRFDVADRQFHSIPQTFKLLMDNPNDVKELIPEFFYFPEFLKNMNKFDLGVLQVTKERVDDVLLPPWANTPEDFINIHRRALESEYVSHNLHHWIDLIFGYKQRGPRAVDALNVFYYCSYEGAVDLDKISNPVEREAVEGMINNFGQTPSQLLREPHPKRLSQDETVLKLLKFELKKPDLTAFLDRIISVNCDLSNDKDPLVFLCTPRSPPRSFLQVSPDVLVSISKSGILGCNSWVSQDKDRGFLLEVDATTTNIKNRKRLGGPFHPTISLHSQLFAVSLDGRHVYAGGIWDNSLKVFNVSRGKTVASIIRHLDIITCIALDNCGSYLVTGSKDCTCIVWSLIPNSNTQTSTVAHHPMAIATNYQINTNNNLTPQPINTLYGHDSTVSCVAIMTELDVVVSGSLDGTINVHTIKEGQFVQTLSPMGCTGLRIEITFISISYQGHIAFSALDDTSHSVHVFSINGSHLGSKYVSGRVTGLTTASDYLVVADDAGDITMSRLYGLKPVFDIPLHIPIQTVVVTPGNTHILAPLRDGKLAVIGISLPTTNKKHSVLNV